MSKHDIAVDPAKVVTTVDLKWWLALADDLTWRFAKSMPQYPHEYVVVGDGNPITSTDTIRVARVIQTFGRPAKFNGKPKLYLDSEDGQTRYWVEFEPKRGESVEDVRLVNRASNDTDWGDQNVPLTETGKFSFYDRFAASYDEMYEEPDDLEENRQVKRMLQERFPDTAPSTLDVGCGTGLLLDMGITSPRIYTGIDPSQGMLNQLYRKHPKAATLYPATADEALPVIADLDLEFDLVVSLFGSASYLTENDFDLMWSRVAPGGTMMWMMYEDGYLPAYYEGPARELMAESCKAMNAWMRWEFVPYVRTRFDKLGNFDVWTAVKL